MVSIPQPTATMTAASAMDKLRHRPSCRQHADTAIAANSIATTANIKRNESLFFREMAVRALTFFTAKCSHSPPSFAAWHRCEPLVQVT